jgi:phosphoenolpyruvate carboxylase
MAAKRFALPFPPPNGVVTFFLSPRTAMSKLTDESLKRDVRMLGDLLGAVITELAGKDAFDLVEEIRGLALGRRTEAASDGDSALVRRIATLGESEARVVLRAFGVFFDMSNLAEDRHRVRVLRHREAERGDTPLGESIAAAISELKAAGATAADVQSALNELQIELVFTAHPSEAKRRSIRAKLRRMRQSLQELDRSDHLPREQERLKRSLRTELTILWQTDFLRPSRPTVMQEVERGLSIAPRLWEVIPRVYSALRRALKSEFPDTRFDIPVFLRFGSWMGGDRDGNPFVTAEVTAKTFQWLRDTATRLQLESCRKLHDFVSISQREQPVDQELLAAIEAAKTRWPECAVRVAALPPSEIYRQWLTLIAWRLEQSQAVKIFTPPPEGAYRDGDDLVRDIDQLLVSLRHHHGEFVEEEVLAWRDCASVFGLHFTRLDVRQDARRYAEVMSEILAVLNLAEDFSSLDERARQAVLSRTMPWQQPIPEEKLSPLARDTIANIKLLRGATQSFGSNCLGGSIISLTEAPSEVLSVLWLWKWTQSEVGRVGRHPESPDTSELRIVPLFEKIRDLAQAAETLEGMFEHPAYRAHLAQQGDRQMVMLGYSDSTKDGGYLAACWGLYRAQQELEAVAEKFRVKLTFFHGRGGSLGRGGGPAARGILSLPPAALDGTLRLTEQGEVLAERYDDVQIAYRHLEQVTWATLVASAMPRLAGQPSSATRSDEADRREALLVPLSERSYTAYRELVDQPGFIHYFGVATPVDEIENLPIASRPARRRGERTLNDLRAIPWVFSWTQNRCLIPAWYGVGTAFAELKASDPSAYSELSRLYRDWPFFQATIDNACLALAKAEMFIAARYSDLMEDAETRTRLWGLISAERDRTRTALLDVTGQSELLAATPWLQRSIEARNPYVDPLNLLQIELLKRRRVLTATPADQGDDSLRDLLRLSVQGIAAGMRTTG